MRRKIVSFGLSIWFATALLSFSEVMAQDANPEAADEMTLVLLGTGTPNADPERSGPALAVVAGGQPYLVDMGPGVVRRVAAAKANGVEAMEVTRLTQVFVTHLHSDHTVGYPDLIFSPWVLERNDTLHVHGPAGIGHMTEHILKAYEQDIYMRLFGLEPRDDIGYIVDVNEMDHADVYEDENVRVTAFSVPHGSWPNALGYTFEADGKRIVISGDTGPSEEIIRQCSGCDILVHEVYSTEGFQSRPPDWQRYHAANHTSTEELAEIAQKARPKLLVLYHQLFWGVDEEALLDEIRALYDGEVVSGNDLDVFR